MKNQLQKTPVIASLLVFSSKAWQSQRLKLKIYRLLRHSHLISRNDVLKKAILILVLALTITSCNNNINCEIETTEGTILVELYSDKAPITVANFLKYVDAGLYTNGSFFRVTTAENEATREVKIEVIQGGKGEGNGFDPIELETTQKTGILHEDGTLSMARSGPNTATNNFFICINAQPSLDFAGKRNPDGVGFAAFGKVTQGMDIVRKIQSGKNENQRLLEPVLIKSIKRVK